MFTEVPERAFTRKRFLVARPMPGGLPIGVPDVSPKPADDQCLKPAYS